MTFVCGFGSDLDLVLALPVGLMAGIVADLVSHLLAIVAAGYRTS